MILGASAVGSVELGGILDSTEKPPPDSSSSESEGSSEPSSSDDSTSSSSESEESEESVVSSISSEDSFFSSSSSRSSDESSQSESSQSESSQSLSSVSEESELSSSGDRIPTTLTFMEGGALDGGEGGYFVFRVFDQYGVPMANLDWSALLLMEQASGTVTQTVISTGDSFTADTARGPGATGDAGTNSNGDITSYAVGSAAYSLIQASIQNESDYSSVYAITHQYWIKYRDIDYEDCTLTQSQTVEQYVYYNSTDPASSYAVTTSVSPT